MNSCNSKVNLRVQLLMICCLVALARHRTLKTGITYNPSAKQQSVFRSSCGNAMPKKPMEGPLKAALEFCFKRPNSHYRSVKKMLVLKDNVEDWHWKRKGALPVSLYFLYYTVGMRYLSVCISYIIH